MIFSTIGPGMLREEPLERGLVLGRYRILGWANTGGMAVIYRCEDTETEAWVALKVISQHCAAEPILRARFEREIEILKRLSACRNIVPWRADGFLPDEGRRYLVLDWAPGDDLEQFLEEYRNNDEYLDALTALEIARDLAWALQEIHDAGVVHRDLKPGNVMINRVRTGPLTMLLDFGLAAETSSRVSQEDLTQDGPIGTDAYASPEQLVGIAPDPSMDIWALGAIMLELFGHRRASPNLRTDGIPDIFRVNLGLPGSESVETIVRHCLSLDPRERPSASEVLLVLDGVLPKPDSDTVIRKLRTGPRPTAAAGELVGQRTVEVPVPEGDSEGTVMIVASECQGDAQSTVSVAAPESTADSESTVLVPVGPVDALEPRHTDVRTAPQIHAIRRGDTQPNLLKPPSPGPATFIATAPTPPQPGPEREGGPDALHLTGSRMLPILGVGAVALFAILVFVLSRSLIDSLKPESDDVAASTRPPTQDMDPPPVATPAFKAATLTPRREAMKASPEERIEVDPPPFPDIAASHASATPPSRELDERAGDDESPVEPLSASKDKTSLVRKKPTPGRHTKKRPAPVAVPSVPAHATAECENQRKRAKQASADELWTAVLQETKRTECWSSPTPRRLLRVEALLELSKYKQCLAEGADSSSPKIKARVAVCRQLSQP